MDMVDRAEGSCISLTWTVPLPVAIKGVTAHGWEDEMGYKWDVKGLRDF